VLRIREDRGSNPAPVVSFFDFFAECAEFCRVCGILCRVSVYRRVLFGGISRVLCVLYVCFRRAEIDYWHVPNSCFVSVGSVPSTVFGCFWGNMARIDIVFMFCV